MTASTYLPRGFSNTPYLLGFNVVNADGILKDPVSVGFRILDPDGDRVFPGSGFHNVLNTAGRLGTGRFYAYSSVCGEGWTPAANADLGEYEIEWQWQLDSDSDIETWSEPFDVVAARSGTTGFLGFPYRTYVSPVEIRAEGLATATATDERIEELIERAQDYIEDQTQNLFRPVYEALRLDGPHTDRLFLHLPIVGVESVYANRSSNVLAESSYVVAFNRVDLGHRYRPNPDHRRNPVIALVAGSDSIYDTHPAATRGAFVSGKLNQEIRGVFGFLESDGAVPRLIREAMMRLVYATATAMSVPSSSGAPAGPLKSLLVDGSNRMEWATTSSLSQGSALSTSREVEEILAKYRAPIGLGSPAPRFAVSGLSRPRQ